MNEELDLKILKAIISDKVSGLTYVYKYDHELFDDDIQKFAKLVIDYTKHFKAPPTRRTLLDRHAAADSLKATINSVWDEIDELEYDINEYSYDLETLKNRYRTQGVEKIRELAGSDDPENPVNPEEYYNNITLEINKINSLDLERTHTQKPIGDFTDEFSDNYEARKNNPKDTTEIPTGCSLIDAVAGGISSGELYMIGGETNSGKSMFLSNIAKSIWLQKNTIDTPPDKFQRGYNIMYFSLEMSYEDCFSRLLCSLANVPQRSVSKAILTPEEENRVNKANKFIKEYQEAGHYFDIVDVPRNLTIEEVELRYHDAMLRYRPDVVIVDYMGLMHSTTLAKEQDWLKLGGIAASLHEFSRAYDCGMFTAAQLTDLKRSGGGKDDGRAVGVHRWGRSSLIMHHVNLGIQIETRMNEKSFEDLKIHVVKNRKGPLGNGSMIKNFANASLVDVPYDEEDLPVDISANIQDLIKSVQDAKNKEE